jgi:hypothetical protein
MPNKLVIEISGGVVVGVFLKEPIENLEVEIRDFDNANQGYSEEPEEMLSLSDDPEYTQIY